MPHVAIYRGITAIVILIVALLASSARVVLGQTSPANPPTITLTVAQHAVAARLIAGDPEAAALFKNILDRARAALTDTPDPIDDILSEGKLRGDPVKVKTQASLQDMKKIDALGWAGSFSTGADADAFNAKARTFLLAWATTNASAGDPIDDTNLEPAIVAYGLTRAGFTDDQRATVDAWLKQVATAEEKTGHWDTTRRWNNWNSHRLKIVGLIAFLLNDRQMIDRVTAAYADQIGHNLNPDGTTYDFNERDALHYHVYDLEPLLTLAIAARTNGDDYYDLTSNSGASLSKCLDFLVPYCNGTKIHPEFVNSKVGFDKARAKNGEAQYLAGRPYNPLEAANVLSLGAAFDPKYADVEHALQKPEPRRFGSWRDVLDAAQRPL